MEGWGNLASFVLMTGWPILFGLLVSTLMAYWLSIKLQAFIYGYTGRVILSFLYGLPAFVFLFFFLSLFTWATGFGLTQEMYEEGAAEAFVLLGGLFVLPFFGILFLVGCVLLAGKARKLKTISVPKIFGIKYFLYSIPVLILALLAALALLLNFG